MTAAVRRALCSVMEYRLVEKSETILLRHGDIVDKWTVILNGLVELLNTDGSLLELHDRFEIFVN
jgi:signal-transduction protein with cAMP-binding, CBS, and nucleotidyltransferase domain